MMIDLPPYIEQAITARAEQQGLTVIELLAKDYISDDELALMAEIDGLNCEKMPTLSQDELKMMWDLLDEPPRPNPRLKALMAQYGGLNVKH